MTKYTDCMSKQLKGKMAGKPKAERERIFKAAAKKCSGKSGGSTKSKPKSKSTTTRRVTTTTPKKKVEKKTRKTAIQKAKTQGIPVSPLEKKTQKLFQRVEQVRLALGTPQKDCTINIGSKSCTIHCKPLKRIKRRKFGDAVKALEKAARGRI